MGKFGRCLVFSGQIYLVLIFQGKNFEFWNNFPYFLGETTEESRESSAQPESTRPVDQTVLDQIQKSIRPPPSMNLERERSIPLVVAVADAARNPRIRGKPSRLRDLQQPVPMEENPEEPIIQQR